MIQIIEKRGCGKTTELIKKSHELSIPILTFDNIGRTHIQELAKRMELSIKQPITINEIEINSIEGNGIQKILIDDLDSIIQLYLKKKGLYMAGFSITKW